MPERLVTVHRFEQLWREEGAVAAEGAEGAGAAEELHAGELPRAGYLIECSAGTYVRSLIADLGDAYCEELRRTAIGPFEVAGALAPPARGEVWEPPPGMPIDIERALDAAGLPSQ
jgi:tRNA pseudouridine55 synthase